MVENRNIGSSTSCTRSKSVQPRMNVVAAIPTAEKANPTSTAAGRARQRPVGVEVAEAGHHHHEHGGVERPAQQCVADFAPGDVHCTQGRGQHGVEDLGVLELEIDVEGALVHRPVHRRGGQEGRRHIRDVGDGGAVGTRDAADQLADADADRQQIEDRLGDARQRRSTTCVGRRAGRVRSGVRPRPRPKTPGGRTRQGQGPAGHVRNRPRNDR